MLAEKKHSAGKSSPGTLHSPSIHRAIFTFFLLSLFSGENQWVPFENRRLPSSPNAVMIPVLILLLLLLSAGGALCSWQCPLQVFPSFRTLPNALQKRTLTGWRERKFFTRIDTNSREKNNYSWVMLITCTGIFFLLWAPCQKINISEGMWEDQAKGTDSRWKEGGWEQLQSFTRVCPTPTPTHPFSLIC